MNGDFNPKKALKNFIASHSKYEKKEHFNKNVNLIIQQIKDTNGKIAIISDFDFTLTRRFDLNNEEMNYFSTYCVFENFKDTTENYKLKSQELFNTYHKYETDETLDFPTRNQLVLKWYKDNLDLIVEENLTKSHFEDMIDHSHEKFYFRQGILELFEIVLEYEIPFYIISGGLHDIIEHSLKAVIPFYNLLEEKKLINIIANKFSYDEQTQKMTGYQEPIVYTFNKGEMIKNYFDINNDTTENIIVLGDHVNDVDSIKNLAHVQSAIKIGFLNSKKIINQPEDFMLYEVFSKKFDIGIMNDGTLNFVNHILFDIFSNTIISKNEANRGNGVEAIDKNKSIKLQI